MGERAAARERALDSRVILGLLLMVQLTGCVSSMDYQGARLVDNGRTVIPDVDVYKVDPESYPRFRTNRNLVPPQLSSASRLPMAEIDTSDVWHVTHALNGYYLIYSETFNKRLCEMRARWGGSGATIGMFSGICRSHFLYHIWISPAGNVSGGWQQLSNPDLVGFKSERWILLKLSPNSSEGWGSQPLFDATPHKRTSADVAP